MLHGSERKNLKPRWISVWNLSFGFRVRIYFTEYAVGAKRGIVLLRMLYFSTNQISHTCNKMLQCCIQNDFKAMCHTDGLLWSAREIASMALPAARERHAKNVWHIAIRACEIPRSVSKTVYNFFHYGLHLQPKKKQHVQRRWCP